MQPSPRAPIESLLAELDQRERALWGQLGELEQEIDELRALNRPIGQRRLARQQKLRAAYGAVQQRFSQLHVQRPDWYPPGASAPGDF